MFLIYILAYFYLRQWAIRYLGTAFEVIALQQVVSDRWSWYFGWGLNATIALLDDRSLKAGGWNSEKLNTWLVILVPIYLYKRDQLLGAGMTRFWVWLGAFAVSLLPIW